MPSGKSHLIPFVHHIPTTKPPPPPFSCFFYSPYPSETDYRIHKQLSINTPVFTDQSQPPDLFFLSFLHHTPIFSSFPCLPTFFPPVVFTSHFHFCGVPHRCWNALLKRHWIKVMNKDGLPQACKLILSSCSPEPLSTQ